MSQPLTSRGGGGFLPASFLSPPPSSTASTATVSATLPHPRSTPLKPGGTKESALIRYLDSGIFKIERRFAKRGTQIVDESAKESDSGYKSFIEVAVDIGKLFDLVWVSGTPGLQTPYLLSLASLLQQYLPEFDAVPRETFKLITRLDIAFASLLQGRHVETGETLPGFEMGRGCVSGTEKVRMKSMVERTRGVVAEVMDGLGPSRRQIEDVTDASEAETGDEMDIDGYDTDDAEETHGLDMRIARVYDRTLVELGDTIGATPIGIVSKD